MPVKLRKPADPKHHFPTAGNNVYAGVKRCKVTLLQTMTFPCAGSWNRRLFDIVFKVLQVHKVAHGLYGDHLSLAASVQKFSEMSGNVRYYHEASQDPL